MPYLGQHDEDDVPGLRRLALALHFLVFLTGELDSINECWEIRKKELGLS